MKSAEITQKVKTLSEEHSDSSQAGKSEMPDNIVSLVNKRLTYKKLRDKYSTMIRSLFNDYYLPYGSQILSNPNLNLAYVCILKNAHSWTSNLLNDNLDFELAIDPPFGVKYIVILRDPIDRWVSGVSEFMTGYNEDYVYLFDDPKFCDILFDVAKLEDHTSRQIDSVLNLNIEDCLFFKCDSSLEQNLTHFICSVKGSTEIINNSSTNAAENQEGVKPLVYSKLKSMTEIPRLKQKLLNYYKHDIQLIDHIDKNGLWYSYKHIMTNT